jgi:hypothetical protein
MKKTNPTTDLFKTTVKKHRKQRLLSISCPNTMTHSRQLKWRLFSSSPLPIKCAFLKRALFVVMIHRGCIF